MGKLRASSFTKNPKGTDRNGKLLSGTRVQLTLASALLNGPLPSHYLRALWPKATARDTLTFLRQEGIIQIPKEANRSFGRPRVWELSKDGVRFLQDHGAYTTLTRHGNGQYKHSHMAAVIEYLFSIVPEGVTFHRHDLKFENYAIKPDSGCFGYELVKKFHLVGFEADRGTEPLTGYASETIESKIQNYATFFASGGYRPMLRNCAVAFITMSEQRAQNIIDLIKQKAGTEADHFLVRALPDFIHWEKYPDPTDFLLTTNWETTNGPLNIHDILKGTTDGQTRKGETSSTAIGHHQESGGRA